MLVIITAVSHAGPNETMCMYAPWSAMMSPVIPTTVPSLRAAMTASTTASRACTVAMNDSLRPSFHMTGRLSLIAMSATADSSA